MNAMDTQLVDGLRAAIQEDDKKLQEAETRRAQVEAEIQRLRASRDAAVALLRTRYGVDVEGRVVPPIATTNGIRGSQQPEKVSTSDIARQVLSETPGLTVTQLVEALKARGKVFEGANSWNTVWNMLRRRTKWFKQGKDKRWYLVEEK
jgi:hypothetical protein